MGGPYVAVILKFSRPRAVHDSRVLGKRIRRFDEPFIIPIRARHILSVDPVGCSVDLPARLDGDELSPPDSYPNLRQLTLLGVDPSGQFLCAMVATQRYCTLLALRFNKQSTMNRIALKGFIG